MRVSFAPSFPFALRPALTCLALRPALCLTLCVALSLAHLSAACTLPAGEPCCADDLDCSLGARCFESRCALLCDDDSQCDEGDTCLDAGVCGALARGVAADSCTSSEDDAEDA